MQLRVVPGLDRVDELVALLDEVLHERLVGLLAVPRAPAGRSQTLQHGDEFFELRMGGVLHATSMLHDGPMNRRVWVIGIVVILIAAVSALAIWALDRFSPDTEQIRPIPTSVTWSGEVPGAATDATIEYVHDGDTLFLTDGRKVRLLGVDTPEVGENLECYGDEATALLRSLLPEGTHVRVLADTQALDQYGRSLLLLWQDDATFVNLALIQQGAAEAVVLEPNLLYASEFEAAEDAAQAAGLGLWGTCR